MGWPIKVQGRYLFKNDIDDIRKLIKNNPLWSRTHLSKELCKLWNWLRPDGQIKDMACRELLRKLASRDLIKLPAPKHFGTVQRPIIEHVEVKQRFLCGCISDFMPVQIVDARESAEYEKIFNYLMKEYHYLSYSRPVGQNMKYLILGQNNYFLGGLLFGAAAWKALDRDNWIGWPAEIREQNLGLICNNTRFLVLPWVNISHLASHALGYCLRRLPKDWQIRYGSKVVLVETFVDTTRYKGTCYKASNWLKIGSTKGRSRQDRNHRLRVPVKDIWVYPLQREFRKVLLSP